MPPELTSWRIKYQSRTVRTASRSQSERSYHDYPRVLQHHKTRPVQPGTYNLTDTHIEKRPLFRPPISSPYSGSQQKKTIYISSKTPFLSAVKGAEKLLHLSDKRLVQSATTLAKQNHSKGRGKRKRGGGDEDEILEIAEAVERQKRRKNGGEGGEEVVLKGTGKAIQKVMELGLWFQQREEYAVRLRTGSVAAIDDLTVDEDPDPSAAQEDEGDKSGSAEGNDDTKPGAEDNKDEGMEFDATRAEEAKGGSTGDIAAVPEKSNAVQVKESEPVPETRIRYTSSLEVAVSLR